jgi:LmbE family N-acetylglucosaminyl deacetylase
MYNTMLRSQQQQYVPPFARMAPCCPTDDDAVDEDIKAEVFKALEDFRDRTFYFEIQNPTNPPDHKMSAAATMWLVRNFGPPLGKFIDDLDAAVDEKDPDATRKRVEKIITDWRESLDTQLPTLKQAVETLRARFSAGPPSGDPPAGAPPSGAPPGIATWPRPAPSAPPAPGDPPSGDPPGIAT